MSLTWETHLRLATEEKEEYVHWEMAHSLIQVETKFPSLKFAGTARSSFRCDGRLHLGQKFGNCGMQCYGKWTVWLCIREYKNCILLGHYAASSGNFYRRFETTEYWKVDEKIRLRNGPIFRGSIIQEDGTGRLYRNVGKQLPLLVA